MQNDGLEYESGRDAGGVLVLNSAVRSGHRRRVEDPFQHWWQVLRCS